MMRFARRAAHDGVVRVAAAGRSFVVPAHRHLREHAAQSIADLAVREDLQSAVAHIPAEEFRKILRARHALELLACHGRGPASRLNHFHVRGLQGLFRKRFPLHEIDEMRRYVQDPFALLPHVEEPLRALQLRARHHLREVVHALFRDGGLFE